MPTERVRRFGAVARYGWLPIALVALWQWEVYASGLPALLLPAPTDVLNELARDWHGYLADLLSTLAVAIGGTGLGLLVGYAAALLSALSGILRGVLSPSLIVLRSVPLIAMIPVLARILGYGQLTVVVATAVMAFFPGFVFTAAALAAVPPAARELLAALGVGRLVMMRRLQLPYSLPGLVAGARLSAATCMLAALTAEFLVSGGGLGDRLARDQAYLSARGSWAVFLLAMTVSALLYLALAPIERSVQRRLQ